MKEFGEHYKLRGLERKGPDIVKRRASEELESDSRLELLRSARAERPWLR